MATFQVDLPVVTAHVLKFGRMWPEYGRAQETYGTAKDALDRVRELCKAFPAPYNDPANHPDFVPFMRLERNLLGLVDHEDTHFHITVQRLA